MVRRRTEVLTERSVSVRLPPHPARRGGAQTFSRWVREQQRPIAIDLFSGCGGLSLGLEQAGFSVVLSVDTDAHALETHAHNIASSALLKDLADPEHLETIVKMFNGIRVDLVAGGPPCQPFSRAGRAKLRSLVEAGSRPERDRRAELWKSFLEVVGRLRPRAVLMENVPDMALGDDLLVLRSIVSTLEDWDYCVDARLIDAWRHGVPQHRQRLILMAVESGLRLEWPSGAGRRVTLRDAIGDLPRLGMSTGHPEMGWKNPAKPSRFQTKMRSQMNGNHVIWDHVTRPVRDDDREAFSLLKPGMRYDELPARLRRYRSDIFNDKYNRLPWDDLSRSITAHIAKDGYWYIHPLEERTLTVREAARIQTFPDHFRFAGTRSHQFRQIGNAVPPLLGEALGRSLLKALAGKPGVGSPLEVRRFERERRSLLAWAADDAFEAPWRHPGHADAWQPLVGVVLGDRVGATDANVRLILEAVPLRSKPAAKKLAALSESTDGVLRDGLSRLSVLAGSLGSKKSAWSETDWVAVARLGPAEASLVRLLGMDDPALVSTSQALRVMTRFFGASVDQKSTLTHGRMLLGRFVGLTDDDRSIRINAAVHALGRITCRADAPECSLCPLTRGCHYSEGA